MVQNEAKGNMDNQFSENESGIREGISTMPLVAIVILNWNGKKFLTQFLPSVMKSTYSNKKIIVADNASTDDSVLFLREHYPTVEILQNTVNEGFANGYNTALRQVAAEYYVLLNSDVEVTPGWIEPVITLMEADKKIAACQPKMLDFNNKTQFEYAGASGGWMDNFGYPFLRGRVFDHCETDVGQYDNAQPCFWASGASMFVRAAIYHELNGLDAYFFAHQEEIDLCWRMQLAGYSIYVQPASVVYHVGGGTLPRGNNKKTYLNFRNNLIMLYKNLPMPEAFFKIWFRLLLDAIAAWKALLSGDGGYFLSVIKAHVQFVKWLLFNQKQSLFPANKKTALAGWYKGSVVWDYFIRKKTKFSEIVGNK
jgi:GT2 family glycosyltransferase